MGKKEILTIDANETSEMYPLLDGWNKITINYAAGAAGTITPKYRPTRSSTNQDINIPAPVSGVAVTGNAAWDISGPGYILFVSTGVSGIITATIDWLLAD